MAKLFEKLRGSGSFLFKITNFFLNKANYSFYLFFTLLYIKTTLHTNHTL